MPSGQDSQTFRHISVCTERERLLRGMSAAIEGQNEAVTRMAALAGSHRSALFAVAKEQVTQAKQKVAAARNEFEAHIREHGCGQQ